MKRFTPLLIIFSILGILIAGCGGSAGEEVITPDMILADGVTHMASLPGFEFSITQEGPIVFLDADEMVQFGTAVGHYVSPDKAYTTVTITALGMLTEITVISLPDIQWASNPLGSGLADVIIVGEEELEEMPGLPLTHLSGTVPGEVILEISKGLINIESMAGDLWMDTATNEVHRVVLTDTSSAEGEVSVWTFDFWSFGETIEITAP